jgi:HSP20 family molecular chaperone IbpA
LSARWRRSKRSLQRLNIFKNLRKASKKKVTRKSPIESPWIRRQSYTNRSRGLKIRVDSKAREPEPLIDVLEDERAITVVAELAGFSKEDFRINVKNQRLTLSAEGLERKYYKSLNLPKQVIPDTIHMTYKNGVLEVTIRKIAEEKTIDKVAG